VIVSSFLVVVVILVVIVGDCVVIEACVVVGCGRVVILIVVHIGEGFSGGSCKFESSSFSDPAHSGRPLSPGCVQISPLAFENTVPIPHSNLKVVSGLPLPQSTHL